MPIFPLDKSDIRPSNQHIYNYIQMSLFYIAFRARIVPAERYYQPATEFEKTPTLKVKMNH